MTPTTPQDAATSTDIDPFEVRDVRPLWSSLLAFVLTSPLTAAGVAGALTLSPFALPFYKNLALPLKDRVTRAVLFWLLLPTKLRIRVVDHNPSRDDHAQLYVAPHGCIIDPLALMRVLGHVRPVVAAMSKDLPIASTFVDATDPIYVERAKTSEHQGPSVVEQLRESIETTDYRHVVFPEGTYTNRETLIGFKIGAFVVGKPITPVVLHYPRGTPHWNREESGFGTQLYRLAATFGAPMTVEFLPTYYPSQDELDDPKLYADNVRALLSRHTGRALSDKSLHDSPNYKADVPG